MQKNRWLGVDVNDLMESVHLDPSASGRVAIIGLGETDYGADYRAARLKGPEYVAPDAESLACRAFERALSDSGLQREDIDGLCASFPYGGSTPSSFAAASQLKPGHTIPSGNEPWCGHGGMAPFVAAVEAVATGKCDVLAVVHCLPSKAVGRQYGGHTYSGGGRDSYYYYHPWGWSSQAAHWAMMYSYYQAKFSVAESDLGAVALTLRENAMRNENATMRSPLSIDDYLSSRFIVRPIRLFDMCLVNDGAVCFILTSTGQATNLAHSPVILAGWGNATVAHSKMHSMVRERLSSQLGAAGAEALAMAGVTIADIDHFEGYDASSIHLINQLEGYGFVEAGAGLEFWKDGNTAKGGRIPTNTGGGMLSGAYLQGWNLVAEVVRQLRHEAGPRQVGGAEVSMFSYAETDSAHPIVFTRHT